MKNLLPLSLLLLLVSCASEPGKTIDGLSQSADSAANGIYATKETTPGADSLLGYYVGDFNADDVKASRTNFYKNKINISIDSIGGGKIKGHSVVAGNNRPFAGTYEIMDRKYHVQAAEPGDDKYDGQFVFDIDPALHQLNGTWESYNKKLEVTRRSYGLDRRDFTYDPTQAMDAGALAGTWVNAWSEATRMEEENGNAPEALTTEAFKKNASVDKLTKEDVENMFKGDLEVMRNAIYARHGYSFKNRKMRYIFDTQVSWYIPVTTDVRNELTAVEKANIDLIKRYEEHAGKYYDSYGR